MGLKVGSPWTYLEVENVIFQDGLADVPALHLLDDAKLDGLRGNSLGKAFLEHVVLSEIVVVQFVLQAPEQVSIGQASKRR